jgi:His/Glu/Gln/Arg/opine family amino acid ABC transporter permease subunit
MAPAPDDRDFPWWLVLVAGAGLYLFWQVLSDAVYADVLAKMATGIEITLFVTVVAFGLATVLGLGLAVMLRARRLVWRQAARLYVEVMRGVPILVLLIYVAFVFAPAAVAAVGWAQERLGLEPMQVRDVPLLWRAIAALALAYAAFLAEIFRAGLQAVDKGQIEAAQALGLSRWQVFRCVLFPQAFRVVLPPLGNDFVAMVKDSSLVSVVGVADITQMAKVIAGGNFRVFETYNVVALLYLTMTIGLSLLLRRLERRLRARGPGG